MIMSTERLRGLSCIFFQLCLLFFVHYPILSEEVEQPGLGRKERELVTEWTISGKFIHPVGTGNATTSDDITWQLVCLGKKADQYWVGSKFIESAPIIEIAPSGEFTIRPNSRVPSPLAKASFVLGVYSKRTGAIAVSNVFDVNSSPFHVKDLSLKFGESSDLVLRARLLNPGTEEAISNLKVNASLSKEDFPVGVGGLFIGSLSSTESGMLKMAKLPKGKICIKSDSGFREAIVQDVWINSRVSLTPISSFAADNLPPDKVPVIYMLPRGKGIFWDALLLRVFHEEQLKGYKRLAKGTVLEFVAKRASELEKPDVWEPNLTFRVTVGDNSLVKTPVVPNGNYAVKSLSGTAYEDEILILGFCSNSASPFHEMLKSQWIISEP